MLDISFTEILVIATVALVVLGPEKLPGVARTLGHLLGRAQRYANSVKQDIRREMELDELRKLDGSLRETARTIEDGVRTEIHSLQDTLTGTRSTPPAPPPSTHEEIPGRSRADPRSADEP